MLLRAVLTAIAISCTFLRETFVLVRGQGSPLVQIKDVICVLLLSGLQKEELDANTMEKLRRYNVNIYDMNNESLRQECLLKSLETAKLNQDDIVEGKNDTSLTTINQETQGEGLIIPNVQNPETAATDNNFAVRANVRRLIDGIKINTVIPKEQNRNENIKPSNIIETNPSELNITIVNNKNNKDPGIEDIASQPSLDSVMKFWSRLTQKDQTQAAVEITTTFTPPRIEEVSTTIIPDSQGYVHSREMEYVNRMISEYLASQTDPTTTQAIVTKPRSLDIITRTFNVLLDKKQPNEEIDPIALNKAVRAFGESDYGRLIQINNRDNNDASRRAVRISEKVMNYDNNEQPQRFQVIPYNPVINISPKPIQKNSPQKMEALQYLNNILRLNKESKMKNAPISYTERSTQGPIINSEQAVNEKRVQGFQYDDAVSNINKMLRQGQDNIMGNDQASVSSDVIQTIAEMVKDIVMKDIKKEMPTTQDTRSRSTTSSPSTTKRTAPPVLALNKTKEGNQMMQQIMELFKEFNAMRESTVAPAKATVNNKKAIFPLDRNRPPIMAGPNPYGIKAPGLANARPIQYNPYGEKFVQIPLGPADRALQGMPYLPNSNLKRDYRLPPITFQTNSGEIPPLAIQVSKPDMNQHIIVTTQNPFEKHKGQQQRDIKQEQLQHDNKQVPLQRDNTQAQLNDKISEVFNLGKERNPFEDPSYADLTKKLRIAEDIKNEFRDSYRLQKLKEKINYAREHNREKARELSRLLDPTYQGLGNIVGSGHHDALSRHLNANYPDTVNRAIDPSRQDSLIAPLYSNHHEPFSRPLDLNPHNNLNRPMDTNRQESLNRPIDLNQYDTLNRADDLNQRDIITREVLSRLVGSNQHDVISRLVEPSRHDAINRAIDQQINQQSRSHHSDAYERIEHERMHPRFKGSRFHEELERIGNLPRNSPKQTTSCCDMIAVRQQMPLAKSKHNQRYDDTHFRNFLKSQQKVTDMLEKILAAKTKPKAQSVETP